VVTSPVAELLESQPAAAQQTWR